jgi:hypothetical protein
LESERREEERLMATVKINAYRLAWTLVDGGRGHFAFESGGQWSHPVPLRRSEDVAAVAAILRGSPEAYWDTDHAALLCGSGLSFTDSEAKLVTQARLERGDGPFPPR